MLPIIKIIISICIIVIAISLAVSNNKKGKMAILKLFGKLEKYDSLTNIHDKLLAKISLFVSNYETASNYAYFSIFIYVAIVISATLLISFSNFVWYIKTMNLILMLILPYTIIKTIIDVNYTFVKRQVPTAISEFQYWFFRTKKIGDALRETSQHLKGNISKPFQMCYYNMSKEDSFAIKELKKTFNDEHMNVFCQLLLVYMENGGDPNVLNASLTELSTQISLDISFSKKQKDRFIKYKIGAIAFAISTIVINKYIGMLFDSIIQNSNTTVISLVLYFTVYFFFIGLLERY